jgi:hypothetical protein
MAANKKTLYLLKTSGGRSYYVMAFDPTAAESLLKFYLDKADYGFSSHRLILQISVIAKEIEDFNGKPNFTSDLDLLIA